MSLRSMFAIVWSPLAPETNPFGTSGILRSERGVRDLETDKDSLRASKILIFFSSSCIWRTSASSSFCIFSMMSFLRSSSCFFEMARDAIVGAATGRPSFPPEKVLNPPLGIAARSSSSGERRASSSFFGFLLPELVLATAAALVASRMESRGEFLLGLALATIARASRLLNCPCFFVFGGAPMSIVSEVVLILNGRFVNVGIVVRMDRRSNLRFLEAEPSEGAGLGGDFFVSLSLIFVLSSGESFLASVVADGLGLFREGDKGLWRSASRAGVENCDAVSSGEV